MVIARGDGFNLRLGHSSVNRIELVDLTCEIEFAIQFMEIRKESRSDEGLRMGAGRAGQHRVSGER
jgi:hypothetical protein